MSPNKNILKIHLNIITIFSAIKLRNCLNGLCKRFDL